ncbi:MAG: hypothetical protein KAH08_00435 [Methylococcales bacterium]|nr:hypothetical protein [Methylococcales bacterium]
MKFSKLLLLFVFISVQAQANVLEKFDRALEIIPIVKQLSTQYHLSDDQKQQMRTIISTELPAAITFSLQLMENRQALLSSTSAKAQYNEVYIREIAHSQGELITELIIWKESLKKELRTVLEDDQQQFIDDFITQIVEKRLSKALNNNFLSLK